MNTDYTKCKECIIFHDGILKGECGCDCHLAEQIRIEEGFKAKMDMWPQMTDELFGKLPCYNYGIHCLNACVSECDLGKGVKLYCRSCIENEGFEYSEDEYEIDESLIFCQREWELQAS